MSIRTLVLAATFVLCANALAQPFPTKPIRVIVPFPAGGGADVVTRIVTSKMTESLGQPIVVENRAGASGNIGTEAVAKSAPDGYTLLVASAATTVNTSLVKGLSWDLARDFSPIVLMVTNQNVLAAHPSVAASNLRELIALAKAKPGQLAYASNGSGSSSHLIGELFKATAGVNLLHVPYKGTGPAVNDLLGGQVHLMFVDMAAVLPHVHAGKLKALGLASSRRFEGLPDLPTFAEASVPGFESGGFLGLVAPAGTPSAAIRVLNAAAIKALAVPDVRERIIGLAGVPMGGSPEQFGQHLRTEIDQWARVIRANNIRLD